MTLKLLKSTLRGNILQLQITTDCRAHRSPTQWESLVIGPQTPFELWQRGAQMWWYISLFPLLSLGRLSQCLCWLKSPFSQCCVTIQLPSLSFLLEENALEVPHLFQKSFFFFPSKYLSLLKVNPSSSITPRLAPNSPKILFFQAGKSCLIHQTYYWHLEY